MSSRIFTPVTVGSLTLPTRIVRSATELFGSLPDGHVPPEEIAIYRRLSREPLGLILTAHTCVSPEGRANRYQNAFWDDGYLPDGRAIAEACGQIPCIMQLGHGGMKAKGSNGGLPVYTPDTMTEREIRELVRAFGRAALRAKEAGFAGVMLHVAHLYLFSQFFYPEFNHRTDRYGGSAENRFRIAAECAEEIHAVCGDGYPVLMKINATDRDGTAEYERDVADALRVAGKCGIAAAEISGWDSAPCVITDRPYFLDVVRRLAETAALPLIEVGGIRCAADVEAILDAGAVAASVSRPLLCDPSFPTRLREEEGHRSPCRSCGFCFRPYPERGRICAMHKSS